jgi:hypothetical protein
MTRINFSSASGKNNFERTISTLVFAGILIVCSVAVGCSSEKPATPTSINQRLAQPTPQPVAIQASAPAPSPESPARPVHKKVVHRAPVTVAYADEKSGVSFQYPKRYSLKTGEAADKLVSADSVPMNFVQSGGVAVAAVAVPESAYPKSNLASAFFGVSVNKSLTAEQCGEFSGPQAKTEESKDTAAPATPLMSKTMIGDMELKSTDTLMSDGNREEESKYYHVFENGACYEFAIKVATGVETDEGGKPVVREEIFKRLQKILATVKISAPPVPEITASAPVTPAVPVTPAQ